MIILAIDSAGAGCGVCVWRDGEILTTCNESMSRGQDARLMPMVIAAMAQAHLSFADLDRVAVTRGPGSFTGLRVGLAAARGIGLAAGKPVIGIDRFALYRATHTANSLLVVIDSRRAEYFCRYFPAQNTPHEPILMTQEQIDAFITAHPSTMIAGDRGLASEIDTAAYCADLAAQAPLNHPDFAASPLYLRAPDVTFPKAALDKGLSAR